MRPTRTHTRTWLLRTGDRATAVSEELLDVSDPGLGRKRGHVAIWDLRGPAAHLGDSTANSRASVSVPRHRKR
jgi:hypothetical protein